MKRSHDTDIQYVVMETNEEEDVYVDFMPQLWMVSAGNSSMKPRDIVQFYFPRRLQQQSKDSYFRFVKQAKFICMTPQNDGKWELRNGRILKMGLGSLEDALSAQKYYSDYFSTTEAEKEIEEAVATAAKKIVRKKKKAVPKEVVRALENSDSEDDTHAFNAISNYNYQFTADTLPIDTGTASYTGESMFGPEIQSLLSLPNESMMNSVDTLDDPSSEIFVTIDLPTINNEVISGIDHQETANDDNVVHSGRSQNSDCKCHQKIMNKLDYAQKKVLKEISMLRQETNANRKLLLQLVRKSNVEFDVNRDEEAEDIQVETTQVVDAAEVDQLNEKYKATFPITNSGFMIDFNKSLKNDQKFVDQIVSKLCQISGEDEIKTARKILKEICNFQCLKDFTWLGTKKTKSFMDLHLIVEMISKVLKVKYPDCDAMKIVTKVVQQRTKSAKEAWTEFLKKNEESSLVQVRGSVNGVADTANEDDSTTIEPEAVGATAGNADIRSSGVDQTSG